MYKLLYISIPIISDTREYTFKTTYPTINTNVFLHFIKIKIPAIQIIVVFKTTCKHI